MSSVKASHDAGPSSGDEPSAEDRPVPRQETANPPKPSKGGSNWCIHLLGIIPIVAAFVIYNLPTLLDEYHSLVGQDRAPQFDVPPEIMDKFRMFDLNADGNVDPYEFMDMAIKLNLSLTEGNRLNASLTGEFEFIDNDLGLDKEGVTIMVGFQPLKLSTMTKFSSRQQFMFGSPGQVLPGLVEWKKPFHSIHSFGTKNLQCFLPNQPPGVGVPYTVIDPGYDGKLPHMNYYYPPAPRGNEVFIQTILSMFHPNAFINNRFGPRGTTAILRAENDKYYDIIMRVHAEFQLNKEPNYPFWFTPAQFAGRLIITKDAEHVEFFELGVPTDKALNIDMEWITGSGGNEVDIGYIPEMKLFSAAPSFKFTGEDSQSVQIPDRQLPYDFDKIKWNDGAISVEEAFSRIEKKMYPFKEIPYLNYLDAFKKAQEENKLVHFIMLWGALDDQSC